MEIDQIKQLALKHYPEFDNLQTVFIEGALSQQDEINDLKKSIAELKAVYCAVKGPWISTLTEPDKDKYLSDEKTDLTVKLIVLKNSGDVCTSRYHYGMKRWLNYDVAYWMPIPEVK